MKAYVINSYAHPSKVPLTLDAPEPKAGPGQVVVDVYSAGLNFFDILQSQGKYQSQPPFPWVMGAEFAGRIAKDSPVPPDCPFKPGDRVFGQGQGCYAEKVAANWHELYHIPSKMTMDEASGLRITWPTSYEALVGRAELKPGEWVLVTAGAGGVGMAAIQIAKALGAKVIATASSTAKMDVCKKYGGADFAIDYTKNNWHKEVLDLTGGKGVDVVYDPVGKIRDSLKCIAWKGRAIVVGFAGGEIEKLPLNLVLLKNISIVGIHWGAYSRFEKQRVPEVWEALFKLFESGLTPAVYPEIWALEDMAKGLDALEKRKTWGKAIVRVRQDDESGRL